MTRSRATGLLLAVLSLLWLSPAYAWRVGVLVWSENIPGQVAMRQGLEQEAARLNAKRPGALEVIIRVAGDGSDGVEKQIRQMRGFVDDKVDLIIVQPTDNAALGAPLRAANAAGIPVIAYDQYIQGGTLAAFVTSDNRQAGTLGGEYIASLFPNQTEIGLVVVEYPRVSSTVERLDGFLDALRGSGQRFKVLKTYQAVEPVAGRKAGAAILADFPKKHSIDVIFTVNDGGGLAVVEALANAGRDEIKIATVDGDPASVENVKAGRLTVIDAAQFCGSLGVEALSAGYSLLDGRPPARHILVPTFPITRETVGRYSGWLGSRPAGFTKPWKSRTPKWTPQLHFAQ